MQIPKAARIIIDTIKKENFEIYLVGGAVRDIYMNRTPKDFDFTSNAQPDQIVGLFKKTLKNGIKHGTVAVILKNQIFEITTFRSDKRVTRTIEEDLSCRDFTLNAMAWDFSKNRILDIFNGRTDIDNKIINTVGRASDRFTEDPHRIFRAARIASQLNFTISDEISATAPQFSSKLKEISHERVYDELLKIFKSDSPEKALSFLGKAGALEALFSNYLDPDTDYISIAGKTSEVFLKSEITDSTCRFSIFIYYLFCNQKSSGNKKMHSWLKEYKIPNKKINSILTYIQCYPMLNSDFISGYDARRLLRNLKGQSWNHLYLWKKADNTVSHSEHSSQELERMNRTVLAEIDKNPALEISDLQLNGNELMRHLGISGGKALGDLLKNLLEETLRNPDTNTREELLKLAEKFFQDSNKS